MKQTEKADLQMVRTVAQNDLNAASDLLQGTDLTQLPTNVQDALSLLKSGLVLVKVDLNDVLNGNRRQS